MALRITPDGKLHDTAGMTASQRIELGLAGARPPQCDQMAPSPALDVRFKLPESPAEIAGIDHSKLSAFDRIIAGLKPLPPAA